MAVRCEVDDEEATAGGDQACRLGDRPRPDRRGSAAPGGSRRGRTSRRRPAGCRRRPGGVRSARRRCVPGWPWRPRASNGWSRSRPPAWPEARGVGGCVPFRCRGRPSGRPNRYRPLRRWPLRRHPRPRAANAPRPRSGRSGRSTRAPSVARRARTLASRSRSAVITGSVGSSDASAPSRIDRPGPESDEVEERPGPLAVLLDHPGVDEQLEMAGDPRLRLAEDLGQVGHRQLGVAQQGDDAQARLFADRLERVEHRIDRSHPGMVHQLHKDIYMLTTGGPSPSPQNPARRDHCAHPWRTMITPCAISRVGYGAGDGRRLPSGPHGRRSAGCDAGHRAG